MDLEKISHTDSVFSTTGVQTNAHQLYEEGFTYINYDKKADAKHTLAEKQKVHLHTRQGN